MKNLNTLKLAAAALLLVTSISAFAQPGPGGSGSRGRFGPQLPPEQMALVQTITMGLEAENAAVAVASSNSVAASFSVPVNHARITEANDTLAKAREAWAAKAVKLVAKAQASDTKLSEEAVAMLVRSASGQRGFGGFGPPGMGGGGRGPAGPGGGRRGAPGQ